MTDDFYTELEEAFRGSRSLIKERLAVYFPLLQVIGRMGTSGSALDLGCGRGEWLEILKEHDIQATGVDLDSQMLAIARNSGQTTVETDALDYLKTQPDESLVLVSAFQLVEHLPFDGVKDLVTHALRVLVPGGMLLVETPNPENMVVASWKFYLDPTHQRPLPPLLLSFLFRHAGFFRTQAMGLNPPDPPPNNDPVSLRQVLEGMGSDYAVVAQKAGDPSITAHADKLFHTRGIPSHSQEEFVAAYDADSDRNREMIRELSRHAKEMNDRIKEMNARVNEVKIRLQHEVEAARSELLAVRASTSWRITRPLRALKKLFRFDTSDSSGPDPGGLPPTARRIFKDLSDAVKNKERKSE